MKRGLWVGARLMVGAAILAVLVWHLGVDPFLEPFRRVDGSALAAAAVLALLTTVCCAWRWRLVSSGLGTDLPLREAVLAYYRSQFLNLVLPGGVLGDVHRAVRRGRDVGDVGHGVRAVVWERTAGQVVQVLLTLAVLLVLPSPVRSWVPLAAVGLAGVALAGVVLARALSERGPATVRRVRDAAARDLRQGVLSRRVAPVVVIASGVVVAGHAATFLLAARTVGVDAPLLELLPLTLLVLLAMALPTHVAGWGPREGASAWAFAVAGIGAAQGVATAVTYGLLVLAATLPGAVVLAVGAARRTPAPVAARTEEATCG